LDSEDLWIDVSPPSIDKFSNGTENQEILVALPRRKQGRRVSGVFREIRSLAMIGNHAETLRSVFSRMSTGELMEIACVSSMWCTTAYKVIRERMNASDPFSRLWYSYVSQVSIR